MDHEISKKRITALVILRLLIGWHFLYEGVVKLYNPAWTAKAYLLGASGPFTDFFRWLSSDSVILAVDFMNVFGLLAIGIALILGFQERVAAVAGMVLLLFYYLSQPPLPGSGQIGVEGNYFIVNKNLIETAALFVLYLFPTGQHFGMGVFGNKNTSHKSHHLNEPL